MATSSGVPISAMTANTKFTRCMCQFTRTRCCLTPTGRLLRHSLCSLGDGPGALQISPMWPKKAFLQITKFRSYDLIFKFGRLLEGHITWAVAPLILAFSAFIPALFQSSGFCREPAAAYSQPYPDNRAYRYFYNPVFKRKNAAS